ncbi:hypothetical protein [Candidatus Methylobacter favarea]|nr:hypothetical protein [Candidatus Methylobacter favarea]
MQPGPVRRGACPAALYRYKAAVEQGGVEALFDKRRSQELEKPGR